MARVEITKPDKRLFPDGTTKAQLAAYYEGVADVMLPHLRDRPLNLQRFPDGVEGHGIFQQRIPDYFPDWIGRATVGTADGPATHVVARDADTLVYLANQAAIGLHAWLSRADRLKRPDRLMFDLDPGEATTLAGVRRAAREVGELLSELGLEPFVMATGSKGFHVVVPLQRRHGFDDVRAFARDVARVAVSRDPGGLTLEQRIAKRGGRMRVDVQRNTYGHTAVAPYSVRAKAKATVAVPLEWEELGRARPDGWTVKTVPRRLAERGDAWAGIARRAQSLGAARRALDGLL